MNVGIVGFGKIARRAHIQSFMRMKNVRVTCVVDSNHRALKIARNRFHVQNVTSDFGEVLTDDVDIVDICTPPSEHAELCINAAENGKHILVEKPLCTSLEEAKRIEKAVQKNGVKLCIVNNYRYLPNVSHIRELLEKGELGKILSIHVIVHSTTPNLKLETLWRIDSLLEFFHALDLLNHLGGKPRDVFAYARMHPPLEYNIDYNSLVTFENNTVGILDWAKVAGCSIFLLNIYGSGQCVQADLYRNTYRKMSGGTPTPFEDVTHSMGYLKNFLKNKTFNSSLQENIGHYLLFSEFMNSVLDDKDSPVPIQEGIECLKLFDSIRKSVFNKQVVPF